MNLLIGAIFTYAEEPSLLQMLPPTKLMLKFIVIVTIEEGNLYAYLASRESTYRLLSALQIVIY